MTKVFVKREPYMTDPRNITTRCDAYLARVGPVINAIEQVILKQYTVKGLNLRERQEKMCGMFGPRIGEFIETDYSRFDQTILPELLELEQSVYLHFWDEPVFRELIVAQSKSHGVHVRGPSYSREGGRCSGDANTSIGNCIVNLFVAFCAHQRMGLPLVGFVEGDDGIFRYVPGLDKVTIQVAEELGLKLKLEVTTNPKFCGRYHTSSWASHADLRRALEKFSVTTNLTTDIKELTKMKCYSLLATDPGHPVLEPFLHGLLKRLEDVAITTTGKVRYLSHYGGPYVPKSLLELQPAGVTLSDVADQGFTPAGLAYYRDELATFATGLSDRAIVMTCVDDVPVDMVVYN